MRLFFTAAIAIAAIAAPANAGVPMPTTETVNVRIAVADLDLNSAEGRAVLKARIDAKLHQACEVESELRFRTTTIDESCVSEGRAAALAQVEQRLAQRATSGSGVASR
ncbi:MAG: UrcA family protein [Pseudomonadota bacterium]